MSKTKLEIAKKIIEENFEDGDCGLYDSRNIVGDEMQTLYSDPALTTDICYGWGYFEVFGLTDEEFSELQKFYKAIDHKNFNPDYDEYEGW